MTSQDPHSAPDGAPRQSPLPAFFYGGSRTVPVDQTEPVFDTEPQAGAALDKRTLLGLVAGTGMLASVLFAGGVLIGAGMFMQGPTADASVPDAPVPAREIETLVSAEPEAVVASVQPEREPEPVQAFEAEPEPEPEPEIVVEALPSEVPDTPVQPAAIVVPDPEPEAQPELEVEVAALEPTLTQAPEPVSEPVPETAVAPPSEPEPEEAPRRGGEIPPPPPVPLVKSAPFSVQVGAFKVRANADKIVARLEAQGLDPLVVRRGSQLETVWFFVRVGAHQSREQARAAVTALQADNQVKGFVVRAEPGEVVLE